MTTTADGPAREVRRSQPSRSAGDPGARQQSKVIRNAARHRREAMPCAERASKPRKARLARRCALRSPSIDRLGRSSADAARSNSGSTCSVHVAAHRASARWRSRSSGPPRCAALNRPSRMLPITASTASLRAPPRDRSATVRSAWSHRSHMCRRSNSLSPRCSQCDRRCTLQPSR